MPRWGSSRGAAQSIDGCSARRRRRSGYGWSAAPWLVLAWWEEGVVRMAGQREWVPQPSSWGYLRLAPAPVNMAAILGPMDCMSTIATMEQITRIRPYSVSPWPLCRHHSAVRNQVTRSYSEDIDPSRPSPGTVVGPATCYAGCIGTARRRLTARDRGAVAIAKAGLPGVACCLHRRRPRTPVGLRVPEKTAPLHGPIGGCGPILRYPTLFAYPVH